MAGTSTLSGAGWTANPTPDKRFPQTQFIPVQVGQPAAEIGAPGDFTVDVVNRKIYENVAGTWSAGVAF